MNWYWMILSTVAFIFYTISLITKASFGNEAVVYCILFMGFLILAYLDKR